MPTYDWECPCGFRTIDVALMEDSHNRECPECKQMSLVRLIGSGGGINWSCGLKDKSGESIWWPKGESSYFDPGLNRRFNSPDEKKKFMDEHNIVSAGSLDNDNGKLKKKLEQYQHEEKTKEKANV